MTETELQKSVIQWLDLVKPAACWFHVPNESKAHVSHRKKLREMGVKAGVADLVFVLPGGKVGFIELKTLKGIASKKQRAFQGLVQYFGAPYELARSIDDMERILRDWGVLKRRAA